MTQETKHTPGPWAAVRNATYWEFGNYNHNHGQIGDCCVSNWLYDEEGNPISQEEAGKIAEANAEFIVRACNAHYELLEALEGLINGIGAGISSEAYKKADAAINKAKGV